MPRIYVFTCPVQQINIAPYYTVACCRQDDPISPIFKWATAGADYLTSLESVQKSLGIIVFRSGIWLESVQSKVPCSLPRKCIHVMHRVSPSRK